jgi:molybdopterin converting factor small subunit
MMYFASAKEATDVSTEELEFPENPDPDADESISVEQLFELLERQHPKLKDRKILSSVSVAVNLEYIDMSTDRIKPGDKVAIIPPVSGG